jgi:hypothetical protein
MPISPDPKQSGVDWIPRANLGTIELLPHVADRIVTCAKHGHAKPTFLQEPLDPGRVARYLHPTGPKTRMRWPVNRRHVPDRTLYSGRLPSEPIETG